ncbi:MAG: 16S rRNA (uracil(1498)-N(3))-methyltransferase [Candidatus Velthaea sp.]
MPRNRFFIEGTHVPGERVALPADDAHKIATVLRMTSGGRIEVVDSSGAAYAATLAVEAKRVEATLDEALARDAIEPVLRITIAQAIPKGQKMDFIVEKATELGVHAIVPLRSARVIGETTRDAKIERWHRIAKSAAQQSGRLVVPAIADVTEWPALIASFPAYDHVYLPWELADPQPLRSAIAPDVPRARTILAVIGPEGGFSREEAERAIVAGARPISLGRRILRTETAALVVIAALLYERGEL